MADRRPAAPPRATPAPEPEIAYVKHPTGQIVPVVRTPDMTPEEWKFYKLAGVDPEVLRQNAEGQGASMADYGKNPRAQELQGDLQRLRQGYQRTDTGWEMSEYPPEANIGNHAYPQGDMRGTLPPLQNGYSDEILQFTTPAPRPQQMVSEQDMQRAEQQQQRPQQARRTFRVKGG